jgi:hypothetical protein
MLLAESGSVTCGLLVHPRSQSHRLGNRRGPPRVIRKQQRGLLPSVMSVLRPTIEWESAAPRNAASESLADLVQRYFAQDAVIDTVKLRPISGWRSGASVYVAAVTAKQGGSSVQLQPELVKVSESDDEVRNFQHLAQGTALVYGQTLARPPLKDDSCGQTVFGFRLFESGTDVSSLYALAFANPSEAQRALLALMSQLLKWYGVDSASVGNVVLPKDPDQIQELILNLEILSKPTAKAMEAALEPTRLARYEGLLTRVHGDLHLDNLLVPLSGSQCYLIDFGNSTTSGSPCVDLARLEADIVYRLMPFDATPEDFAALELALWSGDATGTAQCTALYLVSALRQDINLWHTHNAAVWLLVGRILNGLRMLSGTWPNVRPYKFESRRRAIVASLKVLAEVLEGCFAGKHPSILFSPPPGVPRREDCTRSLVWLFSNRHYEDCFELANAVANARSKPDPTACLLGGIAGLNADVSHGKVNALVRRVTGSPKNVRDRGLKNFFHGTAANRVLPRNLKRIIQRFSAAHAQFRDSGDTLF